MLQRVSETELVLHGFRLPVEPINAETLIECEVFPSTAKVLLELHAQRKIGSRGGLDSANTGGVLLFDDKRIARFITQIEDLRFSVVYSSSNDELTMERLEHNGKVNMKIRQSPGVVHHFVNGSSSPALRSPVISDSGQVEELTPMYKVWKNKKRKRKKYLKSSSMTAPESAELASQSPSPRSSRYGIFGSRNCCSRSFLSRFARARRCYF